MGAESQAFLLTYDQLRDYDSHKDETELLKAASGAPKVRRKR